MLSGVSVTCFLLSYVVALGIEISRYAGKLPGRNLIQICMLAAGLAAHSIFLINQIASDLQDTPPQLLSNWFQWSILAAWGVAAACLVLTIRNPEKSISLFMIPVVLSLIALAQLVRNAASFQPNTSANLWKYVHGVSLWMGTMFICFGLAFGVMYLIQSGRLKSKKRHRVFKLPALDFLQSMNRFSLFATSISLAFGLMSGVVLSVGSTGQVDWFSGSIVFTFVLFALSLIAAITELSSSGALGGRQSAYLVIANFLFLSVVLGLVIFSDHAQPTENSETSAIQFIESLEASG